MRQHRVIRRERTQDVAGEEHADQRQMGGEPRHQIADRDLGDPQPVGDVGQDAHHDEFTHAGSMKKRSLPCHPRMAGPDMTVPLLFFSSSRRNIH